MVSVHIEVDTSRCDGFGFCEQAVPEVFERDDDGVISLLLEAIPDALAEKVEAATRACPVAALKAACSRATSWPPLTPP